MQIPSGNPIAVCCICYLITKILIAYPQGGGGGGGYSGILVTGMNEAKLLDTKKVLQARP